MSGIKKTFEQLRKMDPALAQALARVRAGTATKDDANVLARGMYTDTLIPKVGNKMAYNDFLSRNDNSGTHVHADLNDFGQINKLHGDAVGDQAIKRFGNIASETSRMFGGKSFRPGGDEFKFWFHKPEQAHGFARELRARLEREPKIAGTHNLAASIGLGHNRNHAENALLEAKNQLGPKDIHGHRQNYHSVGNAPTIIQSKLHEPTPEGWKPSKGMPVQQPKTTPNLAAPGLKFHNPLGKNEVENPVPDHTHPVLSGRGSVGILTAENPKFKPVEDTGNEGLENELKNRDMKFEKVTGKYDANNLEHGFLVHNIPENDLVDLGNRYGQESVIYSRNGNHKMIHTNGPNVGNYHPGSGVNEFKNPPEMYYSTVMHNGHPIHFSMNFDFEKTLPLGSLNKSELGYREVHPQEFETAISKHPNQQSLDTNRDYSGKRTFLSSTNSSGYALKPDGELNHVFSLVPGEGVHAVNHAISNGAKHLSAFDGKLPNYYSKFGFKEYKREPNWASGQPDVVYMTL